MVIRHRETTAIDAHRAVLSHLSFAKRCGILSLEITHDVTFHPCVAWCRANRTCMSMHACEDEFVLKVEVA
jgi:hypothetical protein